MRYFSKKIQDEMFERKRKLHPGMDEHDLNCLCYGEKRFLVIAPAHLEDEDNAYTVREANGSYPKELVDRWLSE